MATRTSGASEDIERKRHLIRSRMSLLLTNVPEDGCLLSAFLAPYKSTFGESLDPRQLGLSKPSQVLGLMPDLIDLSLDNGQMWVMSTSTASQRPVTNDIDEPMSMSNQPENIVAQLRGRIRFLVSRLAVTGCPADTALDMYSELYEEPLSAFSSVFGASDPLHAFSSFPDLCQVKERGGSAWVIPVRQDSMIVEINKRIKTVIDDTDKEGERASMLLSVYKTQHREKVDTAALGVVKPSHIFYLFPELCSVLEEVPDKFVVPHSLVVRREWNSRSMALAGSYGSSGNNQTGLKKLRRRVETILSSWPKEGKPMAAFFSQYRAEFHERLDPDSYGVDKAIDVLRLVPELVEIIVKDQDKWVRAVPKDTKKKQQADHAPPERLSLSRDDAPRGTTAITPAPSASGVDASSNTTPAASREEKALQAQVLRAQIKDKEAQTRLAEADARRAKAETTRAEAETILAHAKTTYYRKLAAKLTSDTVTSADLRHGVTTQEVDGVTHVSLGPHNTAMSESMIRDLMKTLNRGGAVGTAGDATQPRTANVMTSDATKPRTAKVMTSDATQPRTAKVMTSAATQPRTAKVMTSDATQPRTANVMTSGADATQPRTASVVTSGVDATPPRTTNVMTSGADTAPPRTDATKRARTTSDKDVTQVTAAVEPAAATPGKDVTTSTVGGKDVTTSTAGGKDVTTSTAGGKDVTESPKTDAPSVTTPQIDSDANKTTPLSVDISKTMPRCDDAAMSPPPEDIGVRSPRDETDATWY